MICWDAGTHLGCHTSPCWNAHAPLGKPALLDATVQMQLARRGGVKGEKKLDSTQAAQRIQQLRDGLKAKAAADKAPPNPNRKAGGQKGKTGPAAASPQPTGATSAPHLETSTVIITEVIPAEAAVPASAAPQGGRVGQPGGDRPA